MFAVVLKGFLLSLSLCLDLGMVNTALINTGLRAGTRPAFLVGLGSCFGDLFYAVLSLCGLALLFSYTPVRWILWLGGGAVLLWLTWRMGLAAWRSSRQPAASAEQAAVAASVDWSARAELLRGLGMALASPTSLLWFAAVGGAIIAHSTDGSTGMNGLFLVGFFVGGLAWSSFLAVLAGRGRQLLGHKLVLYCNAGSALLFGYFAVSVIADGYRTLL
ncbi:LysE family transporter [Crenobacter sp. SG2305]|uniref:LysE family translocator n=1 Tax=Crenobacter oryzisoli TaxID=3056844 RepID=UPI0025AB3D23|nr:LysE family transporter [Crenobacter sp. SG2305]MDN0082684.1 LysE family transporter [Crenobacter sp. SG2305]